MFPETIETERLRLERLCRENVDPLTLYDHCRIGAPNIEDVTAHVTWTPHETPDETAEFIEWAENTWRERQGAHYVIRPREGEEGAGSLAGACGIDIDWDRQLGEIGVWLLRDYWGRGYGTERAEALLELAFERLDLACVAIGVSSDNDRSQAMVSGYVEAFGGRREGVCRNYEHFDSEGGVDVVRYTVLQEEYHDAVHSRE